MHSVFTVVFGIPIYWFGVMMAAGFVAALASWTYLGRGSSRDFNYCSDLLFWLMVSGVLGARVAYVASEFRTFMQDPVTVFHIHRGGLIYYGGFVGAGLALYFFARAHGERFLALTDFVITSIPLGHVFGRIGCFLNGCCHGAEHKGLLSVCYPRETLPWDSQLYAGKITAGAMVSLPVHPVQLYEAAFNALLYVAIVQVYRRKIGVGATTAFYLMAYPVGRFACEFFRGDERMRLWLGLSVAQLVSLALFLGGLAVFIMVRRADRPVAERS